MCIFIDVSTTLRYIQYMRHACVQQSVCTHGTERLWSAIGPHRTATIYSLLLSVCISLKIASAWKRATRYVWCAAAAARMEPKRREYPNAATTAVTEDSHTQYNAHQYATIKPVERTTDKRQHCVVFIYKYTGVQRLRQSKRESERKRERVEHTPIWKHSINVSVVQWSAIYSATPLYIRIYMCIHGELETFEHLYLYCMSLLYDIYFPYPFDCVFRTSQRCAYEIHTQCEKSSFSHQQQVVCSTFIQHHYTHIYFTFIKSAALTAWQFMRKRYTFFCSVRFKTVKLKHTFHRHLHMAGYWLVHTDMALPTGAQW